MPLRSLRTRLVALFLVSLAIAAFLFAAVAVRQFTQEERSRARSELSRQSLQTVKLIEEFAEKRLQRRGGRAARLREPAWAAITGAHVYFVGRSRPRSRRSTRCASAKAPTGTEAAPRLEALWRRKGEGADARSEARRRHLDDRRRPAGFRYGGQLIGAIVVARPVRSINASTLVQGRRVVPPLLLAVGRRRARGAAAQPAHHAPGARAHRGERAHRAAATTTCT